MKTSGLKAVMGLTVAATLALPSLASAQNGAEDLIEEIMVTATKRTESIYEVPIAISAFEGDQLAKQGIVDIVDIGKFVPNLNITQFSAGHISSANPFIRGIGLQDHLITTDPGVSVYVDGVYLGRQVGQNWNLTNIERIEVLRGPQGTLYGRNSIGGAINIITKTPGTDEGASVGVEVGSRGRVNGDFYGDMQITDTIALAFTGGFKNRDGIGDFPNLPNAGVGVGETQETFGRAAVRFAPSDTFSIVIAADGNDGRGGLRPYTTLIDELPNGAVYQAGYRNSDLADDPYDNNTGQASQALVTNKAYGASITADWSWSDSIGSKLIASSRKSKYKAGLDDDGFEDDLLSFPELGKADQTSVELQVNGDLGAMDFVSGVYFYRENGQNIQDPTTFLTFPGSFYLKQKVRSTAIFANVGYDFSDDLRVSGGLRYNRDDKDAETDVGSGLFTAGRDWDEVMWELAVNYTFDNGLTTYGAIQNGYQQGQFPARPYCLFGDPTCFVAGDNITATNYEVGVKGMITDRFQMSVAVFTTDYDDLPYQVSTTAGAGFNTVNLIVDQTSTGFEWESTWLITDYFSLHASLGWIDVDVDEQQGVTPVAPLTPDVTWSLSPEFTWPLNNGSEITFRVDHSYRDEMWGEPSSDPGRLTKISDRSLTNVDIAWHSADGTFTAGLYGRNVSDERYDNARLNTGDYVLRILSNDPSEFGVRLIKKF